MGFDFVPAIFIGGILFLILILFFGWLTPGYSHVRQSISELGESNAVYGPLVRWVGFVPLGISFIVFADQANYLFSSYVSTVLFILIGLSIIVAGMFPTDPDNRRDTLSGKIHASSVIVLLLLLSAAPFIFSISALYRDPPEGRFLVFSFLMGVLLLIFLVHSSTDIFLRLKASFRKSSDAFKDSPKILPGLQQRILLFIHYIWWFVFIQVL